MNLLEAIDDPRLFRPWFKDPESWTAWRAFISALFALPMTNRQAETFRTCTGRETPPQAAFSEAWLICGRRSGKSFIMALVGVFLAAFRDYRPHLQPGERATVLILAADRRQARTIFRYAHAMITRIPMLAALAERETTSEFEFTNGASLEVGTSDYRAVRGRTIAACLGDEIAFWSSEDSVSPDTEVLEAVLPAMATIPNSVLLVGSSPYAKRGALFDAHRKHYGHDDAPALVWQAPTKVMNPTIPESVIAKAFERDPASAAAEFGAQFRNDISGYVSLEAVEACVNKNLFERPPVADVAYYGFCDPSGGSSDSMTLAIGHRGPDNEAVLDCIRERRAPFSPESVVAEFADVLKAYSVRTVQGDRYAGAWPAERFSVHGITYKSADLPKSAIYQALLPLLMSGKAVLLDNQRLIAQIVSLERRTGRGGRDSIDHAPGSHDDVANAVAGVLNIVAGRSQRREISIGSYSLAGATA
jgi:hypothetical protein